MPELVEVTLVDDDGKKLNSFTNDGQVHFAGEHQQRYQVKVRNKTNKRVEVVVSVDGRDVMSGEEGDPDDQRGYILRPYGSIEIDGYRQNLEEVAAFRFGGKEDSYAERMGTKDNNGIVGVAVYKELVIPPRPILRGGCFGPYHDTFYGTTSGGLLSSSGQGQYKSARRGGSHQITMSTCSASVPAPQSDLGTEYGETISSKVGTTFFSRASSDPDEIVAIFYATSDNLVARGIATPIPIPPVAFPARAARSRVAPGFANAPPAKV